MSLPGFTSRRESGQAAVETALTLPLVLFVVLGTLQLFLMFNARIMTQLAAYRATRAGSVTHGNCERMVHSAILQVLPAIDPFMRDSTPGASAGAKLASAFARRRFNAYDDVILDGGNRVLATGAIVWLIRDMGPRPTGGGQDVNFDMGLPVQRLETRVIFWFPLKIPFANWVISKMMLAWYGLQSYTAVNPLMVTQTARWGASPTGSALLNPMAVEMSTRMNRGEFVFPISATYTMRMMTPSKAVNFVAKNCAPTPPGL